MNGRSTAERAVSMGYVSVGSGKVYYLNLLSF